MNKLLFGGTPFSDIFPRTNQVRVEYPSVNIGHVDVSKMTPDEIMAELKRREDIAYEEAAKALQRKAESDKQLMREKLTDEALFSIAYVPYVIAEVAWDYVDTIFDLSKLGRFTGTKKLARAIKDLRRDYDRKRYGIIDDKSRQGEMDNMEMFQEEMSSFFSKVYRTYNEALKCAYGDVEETSMYVVSSAYVCRTVLKALFKYTDAQEKVLSSLLGYEVSSIIPNELRKLYDLVIEYVGDMPIPNELLQKQSEFVDELANTIADVELNVTSEKN